MAVEKNTYFTRFFRIIAVTESRMGFELLNSRKDTSNRALSSVRIV